MPNGFYDTIMSVAQRAIVDRVIAGSPLFLNPRSAQISSLSAQIITAQSAIPSPPAQGLTGPAVSQLSGALTTASGGLLNFQTHTDLRTSQLLNQISLLKSGIAFRNAYNGLQNGGNPCALFENFIGSLLNTGLTLLNAVQACINQFNSANIAGTLGANYASISTCLGTIDTNITLQINLENSFLAGILNEVRNASTAAALIGLWIDPCTRVLMNAVGHPDLLSNIRSHTGITI